MKRGFLEKLIERIRLVQPGDVQNYLVEIAREKGFLETIFNAILEGVIVTDPSGRIIYLNRAAADSSGSASRPVSANCWDTPCADSTLNSCQQEEASSVATWRFLPGEPPFEFLHGSPDE